MIAHIHGILKQRKENRFYVDVQGLVYEVLVPIAVMKDIEQDKPELLVPIYDLNGNLLWPKQMSYEEVKKHIEEKHAVSDKSRPERENN